MGKSEAMQFKGSDATGNTGIVGVAHGVIKSRPC